MSDDEEKFAGCYGQVVSYAELDDFLQNTFMLDDLNEELGGERFATNIIGHTGIGKTSKVKQFAQKPVEWRGKKFDGFEVKSVPLAQFEEMGDLHGLPDKHVLVKRAADKKIAEYEERWVPLIFADDYKNLGWEVDALEGIRTMYAPPDFIPSRPGPSILNLDDWNRANGRIIKGCMQLLQDYGLMSWKLPPGCHIVMTSNPDEQDYFVTSVDSAILQRLRSVTLDFDPVEWAVWAEQNYVDSRVISFALAYPEMIVTGERNSPRSLTQFGRFLQKASAKNIDSNQIKIMANSLLDKELVQSMFVFMERDFKMVIKPEDILAGEPSVLTNLKSLSKPDENDESRVDVLGVTCDRLFSYLCQPKVQPTKENVKNFQAFITSDYLMDEMRYVFTDRLHRSKDDMDKWFIGSEQLAMQIVDLI